MITQKQFFKFMLFLVFWVGITLQSFAAIWYVDTRNGSDSNTGDSIAQAFGTINHAISQATDLDTVNVLPGRYPEFVHIQKRIRLEALPMQNPTTMLNDEVIIEVGGSGIPIGVKFSNTGNDLDPFTLLRNFVIDGSQVASAQGVLISGSAGRTISPTIEGNMILDCEIGISVQALEQGAVCGSLIRFNHIYADTKVSEGFASLDMGMDLLANNGGAISTTIHSNRIFLYGQGVSVDDSVANGDINIRCICNVVAYNERGYNINPGTSTVIIDNDTIAYGLTKSPWAVYAYGVVNLSPNTQIYNSIVWIPDYVNVLGNPVNGLDLMNLSSTPSIIDNYSIVRSMSGPDPLFYNPVNWDFRILRGSPAINTGNTQRILPGASFEVGYDNNGAPRIIDAYRDNNLKVDVGAFEYTEVGLDATWSYSGYYSSMKPIVNIQIGGAATLELTSTNPNQADIFYLWLAQNESNILMQNLGNLLVDLTNNPPILTFPMGSFTWVQLPFNLPNNPSLNDLDFFLQGVFYDPTVPEPTGNVGAFTRRIILNVNL